MLFAEAALAGGMVFFRRLVAVFLGAFTAGAALVVNGLGFVVFEDLDGRGNLVSIGREDHAVDGAEDRCGWSGWVGVGGVRVIGAGVTRA